MSRLHVLSLIAFLVTCAMPTSLHAQVQLRSNTGPLSPSVNSIESRLQLVTEVIKETYCDGPDPELFSLRLLLRLSFVNVGKERIIFERGPKSIPLIRISKTGEDMIAERFETTINNHIITDNNKVRKTPSVPKKPPVNSFVILQAGENYKTIAAVDILVPRARPVASIINPGNHYLQVGVWTWDESQQDAKIRRKKWQRVGFLWSASVLSTAMPFTIVSQPKPEDCRCENPNISENKAIDIARTQMKAFGRELASYKSVAVSQGCEWHVLFEPGIKDPDKPSFILVIDKSSGIVLAELQ